MTETLLNIEFFHSKSLKSLKSKLKIIGEFGHDFDILGKPSMSRI